MHKFRKNLIIALALLNVIMPLMPAFTAAVQDFRVSAAADDTIYPSIPGNAQKTATLPFSQISINQNASYTRDSLVDVKVKLSPSASKTKLLSARFLLCNWHDECQSMHPDHPYWSDWRNVDTFGSTDKNGAIEFSVKQVLSNPQVEGKKNVCVQVQDTKGNVSPYACDYIYLDTSAPTGSLSINSGAGSTNTNELTLNLSATDPKLQPGTKYEINGAGNLKYSLSTDGVNWTAWSKLADLHSATKDVAYTITTPLTSPTEIVMYVKYADRLGNESPAYSDSIWYGTPTTPVSPPTQAGSGSVVINNGEVFTASQVVTLNLKTSGSKPTSMKVWNRGENSDAVAKVPYSENVAWTLSAGYETKHVYAQFFYTNGSASVAIVDEITYAPVYGISYHDAITGNAEHTLSSMPSSLITGQNFDLTLKVHNFGSMTWPQNGSNPVQIAYHWVRADGTSYLFEGTRTNLNQNLPYQQHDANIRLKITAPTEPGNYILQIDAVHHGHTWFSWSGNAPREYAFAVVADIGQSADPNILASFAGPDGVTGLAYTGLYMVKFPTGNPFWRCGGHDCYTAIAEEMYACSARGIPNHVPDTTDVNQLKHLCWYPIYAANQHLYASVPPAYQSKPWNYLVAGWLLRIPGMNGGSFPVYTPGELPPIPSSFVSLVNHATELDPYGGMNGAYTAWPDLTFDRFIAWDGSVKWNQVKWSETRRPSAPTITSIQVDQTGTNATVYGVAIPKNHPMHIRVWNEFRDCWGCGSGWELHHQVGTAEHVKVVLWKNNWQYIGEVWNDRTDGRWSITLPLDTVINPGDTIYAEVQVEAGFTFHNIRWWDDTTENVYFDLRDPYYFGVPYFASSTSNRAGVPRKPLTNMAEWGMLYREDNSPTKSIARELHQICGAWVKDYHYLTGNNGDTWQTYTNLIFNPTLNWAFRLRGDIRLAYWDRYQGTCGALGLPASDDLWATPAPTGTTGAYQQFSNGTIHSSYLGVFATTGALNQVHANAGGTAEYGFPEGEMFQKGGEWCQEFEAGTLCEITNNLTELDIIINVKSEIRRVLDRDYSYATTYWRNLWMKEDRELIASFLTNIEGTESYVSNTSLYLLMSWMIGEQQIHKQKLTQDNEKRWLYNALYVRNLRTLKNVGAITDLEAFAQGAEFIANYWDNTATGKRNFEMDLAAVFSNRDGVNCIFSTSGCFGNNTDAQAAFFVNGFGGSGFNKIFDDTRYGSANVPSHITGLGINFSFAGESFCGPATEHPLRPPYFLCLTVEGWAVFHETWQQGSRSISNTGEAGSSWEDLFSSLVGITLGRDLRSGAILVSDFGNQIRHRLGSKNYDVCKDFIPNIPSGDYWDTIYCDTVPGRYK